ncbi:DUF2953 domain-containing protein [Clostridium sp. P21]|uniref:DUF2953 domain-containing protein n=1 Tax=Clostridium muellerianum TaxID=2716538 RepID=A0A7Y0EH41_9CLOT|nr:DUF2953 domain-containing protein [Clostridium muellerianum]NMM63356.1 DUF2953 domain-containing protein [Clostridium muellerianum]
MFLFIIFLKILLILMCVILSLLILVMFVPFKYNLNSHINEIVKIEGIILWMFNLFKIKILQEENLKITFFIGNKVIYVISEKENLESEEVKPDNKKVTESKTTNIKDFIKKKFISCVLSYFKDMLKIIKPDEIRIKGVYGFDDPCITGLLCGFIPIISQIIPHSDINLNPVFDDDVINIKTSICGKVFLFLIAFKTLKFVLKKDIRKILLKKSKTSET